MYPKNKTDVVSNKYQSSVVMVKTICFKDQIEYGSIPILIKESIQFFENEKKCLIESLRFLEISLF